MKRSTKKKGIPILALKLFQKHKKQRHKKYQSYQVCAKRRSKKTAI